MLRMALILALVAALAGCGEADLVVYSGRAEPLVKPILDEFEESSGLSVDVQYGDTTELAATLLEEGESPRADVFIGQDAGALARLAERGRLARYDSPAARRVPARFRSADGTWTGLSGRARVLIVNTEEVPEAQWPRSVFELTKPEWRGRVAAPNATNASWLGFVSTMRIKEGNERTRRWLEGMRANDLAILGSHSDVRRAVGTGEFALGLVNHYYVELQQREGSPVEAIYTDQERGGFGTVINAASGGLVRGAQHPENARRLLDHLLTPEVQREFAGRNFEYPLLEGVPAPEGVRPLAQVRDTGVSLGRLGPALDGTLRLLGEVGLGE